MAFEHWHHAELQTTEKVWALTWNQDVTENSSQILSTFQEGEVEAKQFHSLPTPASWHPLLWAPYLRNSRLEGKIQGHTRQLSLVLLGFEVLQYGWSLVLKYALNMWEILIQDQKNVDNLRIKHLLLL